MYSQLLLTLMLALVPGAILAQDKEPTKPEPLTLTITGDIDAKMAPVVGNLSKLFYECYPKLVKRFETEKHPAPRSIRIVMKRDMRVPAYCSGTEISISVEWLTKHPDDFALLTHELTHAVQNYPRTVPGWLTEGFADYARKLYGPEKQIGWELPRRLTSRNSYRDSYRVTGRFLIWLDDKHPGVTSKLHTNMRDRSFEMSDFKTMTGSTIDELWDECVEELSKSE